MKFLIKLIHKLGSVRIISNCLQLHVLAQNVFSGFEFIADEVLLEYVVGMGY